MNIKSILLLLVIAAVATIASCKKDDNNNNTNPVICDPGYEGSQCQIEWRTKFIGNYHVTGCSQASYDMTISLSSADVRDIRINNYFNKGRTDIAVLSSRAEFDYNYVEAPQDTVSVTAFFPVVNDSVYTDTLYINHSETGMYCTSYGVKF